MNWKEFFKPNLAKVLSTIIIIGVTSIFFIQEFIVEPWDLIIAIIFWYVISCLIVFIYKKYYNRNKKSRK